MSIEDYAEVIKAIVDIEIIKEKDDSEKNLFTANRA